MVNVCKLEVRKQYCLLRQELEPRRSFSAKFFEENVHHVRERDAGALLVDLEPLGCTVRVSDRPQRGHYLTWH